MSIHLLSICYVYRANSFKANTLIDNDILFNIILNIGQSAPKHIGSGQVCPADPPQRILLFWNPLFAQEPVSICMGGGGLKYEYIPRR